MLGALIESEVLAGDGKLKEYLVSRSQLGPWLVCSAIVVLSLCDFHILMEPQYFSGLQFCDCGSLTQLQKKSFYVSLCFCK